MEAVLFTLAILILSGIGYLIYYLKKKDVEKVDLSQKLDLLEDFRMQKGCIR